MKIKVADTYRTDDLAVVGQHLAAQLEALGITAVRINGLYLQSFDKHGREVKTRQDGKVATDLVLKIDHLDAHGCHWC